MVEASGSSSADGGGEVNLFAPLAYSVLDRLKSLDRLTQISSLMCIGDCDYRSRVARRSSRRRGSRIAIPWTRLSGALLITE
ncbi:hypothetical protein EUGRSUZ_A00528 [Eucalyptus grandis]|uniref:Uncharacterized protein n=2 Tax=Eucalyptus grandis TaxID=71139 RepID=A0A059DCK1_EUCGR|nr:hypothetical protein EUGRSUZ_A00528 [Eucalyptus grandis]